MNPMNNEVIQTLIRKAENLGKTNDWNTSEVINDVESKSSYVNETYIDNDVREEIVRDYSNVAIEEQRLLQQRIADVETSNNFVETKAHLESEINRDTDPIILRRRLDEDIVYRQNIYLRFLQPPPLEPEKVIIKEVQSEPPPPLPPIVIKQGADKPKTPPPVILREKPPLPPKIPPPRVIIRHVPSEAPKRQIIVEKYQPLPPKPSDIIIERWLPYKKSDEPQKVIRIKAPHRHRKPRKNVIIIHEQKQPRVVREICNMGVTKASPSEYAHRYYGQMMDSYTFKEKLHSLGIDKEISTAPGCTQMFANDLTNVPYTTDYRDYVDVSGQIYGDRIIDYNGYIDGKRHSYRGGVNEIYRMQRQSIGDRIEEFYLEPNETLQDALKKRGINLDVERVKVTEVNNVRNSKLDSSVVKVFETDVDTTAEKQYV